MVAVNVNPPSAEPGISEELLYEKVGFIPHSPGQKEYLFSDARFNIACCGRRWGKSQAAGHRMTYKSFKPNSYNWIVGPTYRLGEKEFRVVYEDYRNLGILKYCKRAYSSHQGDMYIQTPWNAHIQVVSADRPDSLLGEGLYHAIMSESARHHRSTWEQFIEPALADHRGSADFPSTPQGYNWFHGLWMLGQDNDLFGPPNPDSQHYEESLLTSMYRSWRFPAWENSIRFPGGYNDPEIQRLKKVSSPHWFDQEIGASFTTMTGVIYEEWNQEKHVRHIEYNPNNSNFLAMDYGFKNPFVALDIMVDAADNVYVWREYYQSYKATIEHGQYIKDRERAGKNPKGYHVDGMWGDPRGADEAATLALVIGFVAGQDVPWKHGVEQIKRMLLGDAQGPQLFVDPSCTNLIRQMSQLRVKEQSNNVKTDLVEMGANGTNNIQHKVDDHAADALRYFIGPYFCLGAGSHMEDVYDGLYRGSESEDFFTLHNSIHSGSGANDLLRLGTL